AELAGVTVPPNIDGISMVPALTGRNQQQQHEYLYWEFPARGGKQAVRMGTWKGIRLNVNENPEAPIELHNLEQDIGEENNVVDQHPDIVERINQIMNEARVPSDAFPIGAEIK
ncbi:MAG: hypothetical protein R3281_15430, partial [Balneolaceae bacterium]|nr:hypothetical protein [Balneolaceae bacterium]